MLIPDGYRRLTRGEKPKQYDKWYDAHLKEWRVVHNVAKNTVIDTNSPLVIRSVKAEAAQSAGEKP